MKRYIYIMVGLLTCLFMSPVEAQEYPDLSKLNFAGVEAKVFRYQTVWSIGAMAQYQPGPTDQAMFITVNGSEVLQAIFDNPDLLEALQETAGGFFATEMPPVIDWERQPSSIFSLAAEQRFSPKWALVEQAAIVKSEATADFTLQFQDFENMSAPPINLDAEISGDISGWQIGVGVRRYFQGVIEPYFQLLPFYRYIETEVTLVNAQGIQFDVGMPPYDTTVFGVQTQLGVHIPATEKLFVDIYGGLSFEQEEESDLATPIYIGAGILFSL